MILRLLCLLLLPVLSACAQESSPLADYEAARKVFWREVYPNGGETLYCGRPFLPNARRNFNIEHVFPMSWAANGLDCGKRKQCSSPF